ncbi:MAG: type II toxin-antitoxin system RelE/ParE family toxin [Acidobacteria bacterium]|nr:type II toxin-antitoxin system RelE/ParE family toxin [Acidobacteriota bacterium]MYH29797.1 type II toxin-antitoxin system RelE/ParE family toxin [Acidobacteriota bacterium]MYK87541.1 type II toxin-antitoxin system RelE/ParE family toxin [Acidobacteriota bacterium]
MLPTQLDSVDESHLNALAADGVRESRSLEFKIVAKVEQYAEDPTSLANNVIQLAGSAYRRLRVGDYRVLFAIEGGTTVVVLRVRHRRNAYA